MQVDVLIMKSKVPSKVIGKNLGITGRSIRKARQGNKAALTKCIEKASSSEISDSWVEAEEQRWLDRLGLQAARNAYYAAWSAMKEATRVYEHAMDNKDKKDAEGKLLFRDSDIMILKKRAKLAVLGFSRALDVVEELRLKVYLPHDFKKNEDFYRSKKKIQRNRSRKEAISAQVKPNQRQLMGQLQQGA